MCLSVVYPLLMAHIAAAMLLAVCCRCSVNCITARSVEHLATGNHPWGERACRWPLTPPPSFSGTRRHRSLAMRSPILRVAMSKYDCDASSLWRHGPSRRPERPDRSAAHFLRFANEDRPASYSNAAACGLHQRPAIDRTRVWVGGTRPSQFGCRVSTSAIACTDDGTHRVLAKARQAVEMEVSVSRPFGITARRRVIGGAAELGVIAPVTDTKPAYRPAGPFPGLTGRTRIRSRPSKVSNPPHRVS